MAGPLLTIDLPGPMAAEKATELGAMLQRVSSRFHEARIGSFDLAVEPARLGVAAPGGAGGPRPFAVTVSGPGFGDEAVFEAAHAGQTALETLIGFRPTHDVVVSAASGERVDHLVVAELAAATQEIVGGVIDVKVYRNELEAAGAMAGALVAVPGDEELWPRVFGTAEFLRAWARGPEFRVLREWNPSHW